ncbi:hypothetical protein KIH74_20340 [Kineosporia sp. J2-2]|uniref:Uncharacterized protein n=1 Tax=Kineosporia corallincola TaxID=2835133 RepID=A0ABS5TML0_9ACTN|nr:hypothetical protein [Kineosporia corallincola]MBT0771298.1 hypothetical protein [Kineosporia corallincola]
MSNAARPSFGRRVYLNLFKVFGPADVKPVGPPPVRDHADPTVPVGYHLETYTQADGVKKRIMVQDSE